MFLNCLPFIVKFQGRNHGIEITTGGCSNTGGSSISSTISGSGSGSGSVSISSTSSISISSITSSSSSGFSRIKSKCEIIENQSATLLLVCYKLVGGGLDNGR